MEDHRQLFMDIPTSKARSVSPMSPGRDRSLGFFDILTRRFGRRSHDDICYQHHGEEDSRSSSTDSCSSTSGRLNTTSKTNRNHNSNLEISCSSDSSSSSNSAENTTKSSNRTHRRSTSSIRRALESFSISSRSLSCSSTLSQYKDTNKVKKTKKTPPPKRILRQPVAYTYLKGMSGLPTQRVPRSSVCCQHTHR